MDTHILEAIMHRNPARIIEDYRGEPIVKNYYIFCQRVMAHGFKGWI